MSKIQQRKMVQLSNDNVEWFERVYGGSTLSWVLDELLTQFRVAHVHSPQEYARIAAETLQGKIEEKLT